MRTKPFTLVSILILCFAANAFGFDLNKGLKAYYPFNGNANDVSGNNNNPSFNNATLTTDYYGKPNSAYYFNGVDNYMRIPNSATINTTGPISICAWIKPVGFYKGKCHGNRIIMKGDADYLTGNYFLTYDDNLYTSGQNCFTSTVDTIHQTLYAPSTGVLPQNDTPYIQMNVWSSLVYTYDGDRAKLYINCKLVLDYPVKNLTFTNSYDLFFGKMNNAQYPYWFNGVLDEVRIYDRPLDESEVQEYSFGCAAKLPCSNWLQTKNTLSGAQIGDLDVAGQQLTVEAVFNRTQPYTGGRLYAGDLVSKHIGPQSTNYLLRPSSAEITTSDGYFITPAICDIELNKVYHVAMVYNGKELKFYRNGFLMSKVAATGNLLTNDLITTIGSIATNVGGVPDESFFGYINEVRIWNIARTQDDIKATMDGALPNPFKKDGLLAYYSFEDTKNKQGDSKWDAKLINGAVTNAANPLCDAFVVDSCGVIPNPSTPTVIASFSTPDTVCVNTPVKIKNTSVGASSFYWNFNGADLNADPQAVNIGSLAGILNQPVFMDLAEDNGRYYAFVVNHLPGALVRLDFGNSYLNTPTAVNLGSFNGMFNSAGGTEGIQIVKNEGKWYIIVVGKVGQTAASHVMRISFGDKLSNTPVATDWGNIGGLTYPIDLHLFQVEGKWYGFTTNSDNSTLTRFSFGSSFENTPTGTNLGNIGNMNYPTGVFAINENGKNYVFVANGLSNSITRLDFGNSLLNIPTGVNLGTITPNDQVSEPRDITFIKTCNQGYIAFVVNNRTNQATRLNFNSITSAPTSKVLGNIGSLSFPHSLSRFFRDGADIYSFITNVNNNTITRIKLEGGAGASQNTSTLQDPPDVTYTQPGIYNIHLTTDDGLSTQSAFCKQVVVVAPPVKVPLKDTTLCADSLILKSRFITTSLWSDGSVLDSLVIKQNGQYWVSTDSYGCAARDSFNINLKGGVNFSLGADSSFCKGDTIRLTYAKAPGDILQWQDGSSGESYDVSVPGKYRLTVTTVSGCSASDSVNFIMKSAPLVHVMNDTVVCRGARFILYASASTTDSLRWSPATNISDTKILTPLAAPTQDMTYVLVAYKDGCVTTDTVSIATLASPILAISKDTVICKGGSAVLHVTGADSYQWLPLRTLSSYTIANPVATPAATMKYYVVGTSVNGCAARDSVVVGVKEKTIFSLAPFANSICKGGSVVLTIRGDGTYEWLNGVDQADINEQMVTVIPFVNTQYNVVAKDVFCNTSDTLSANIVVKPLPVITLNKSNDIDCILGESKLVASGGISYRWSPAQSLSNSSIFNPIAKMDSTTTFVVSVTGQNGCVSKDSINVFVTKSGINSYPVVNAFTPNGDGLNDYFGIKYWGYIGDYQISIFNRWGQVVFTSSNPDKKWDGTYQGTAQPAGTYIYNIKASTLCGPVIKNGTIVLIK